MNLTHLLFATVALPFPRLLFVCLQPFTGGVSSAFVAVFVCVSREVKIKSPNMKMLLYGTYG